MNYGVATLTCGNCGFVSQNNRVDPCKNCGSMAYLAELKPETLTFRSERLEPRQLNHHLDPIAAASNEITQVDVDVAPAAKKAQRYQGELVLTAKDGTETRWPSDLAIASTQKTASLPEWFFDLTSGSPGEIPTRCARCSKSPARRLPCGEGDTCFTCEPETASEMLGVKVGEDPKAALRAKLDRLKHLENEAKMPSLRCPDVHVLAHAIFESDPRVVAFLDLKAERRSGVDANGVTITIAKAYPVAEIAWNRDEGGWATEARERAKRIVEAWA